MNIQLDDDKTKQDKIISSNSLDLDDAGIVRGRNKDAALIVLENGTILNCNKAAAELLGCAPNKLTWQPVSRLFPQLGNMPLFVDRKINPYLRFLSIAGHQHKVVAINGTHFTSELFFSVVEELGNCCLRLVMQPVRQGQAKTLRHLREY